MKMLEFLMNLRIFKEWECESVLISVSEISEVCEGREKIHTKSF